MKEDLYQKCLSLYQLERDSEAIELALNHSEPLPSDLVLLMGEIFENPSEAGGVKRDVNKAVTFFERAIALGESEANARLGDLIAYGEGIENDRTLAAKYWEQGWRLGDYECAMELIHYARDSRPELVDEIADWLAATDSHSFQGLHHKGMVRLEHPDINGFSGEDAISFLEQSCDKGYAPSCAKLMWLFYKGNVVPKDLYKALIYLDKLKELDPDYPLDFAAFRALLNSEL